MQILYTFIQRKKTFCKTYKAAARLRILFPPAYTGFSFCFYQCKPDFFFSLSRLGRSTGIVTTARITHATPGVGYAHSAHRDWEGDSEMAGVTGGCKDIAYQLVKENQHIQVCERMDAIMLLQQGDSFISLPETKAQVSFSDHNLSVVRRCRRWRCKLFTFLSSPPEPLGQFQPNLAQSILR